MGKSTKTPVGIRLDTEELALLTRIGERHGNNKTAAIVAGLRALENGPEITWDAAMAFLQAQRAIASAKPKRKARG